MAIGHGQAYVHRSMRKSWPKEAVKLHAFAVKLMVEIYVKQSQKSPQS